MIVGESAVGSKGGSMSSDPRPRQKYHASEHRKALWIGAASCVVSGVVLLVAALRDPYWYIAGPIAGGVLLLIVLILALMAPKYRKRREGLLKAVQAARPGVPIVPALGVSEIREDARRAGASTDNLSPWVASPVALAVLPDLVEVWVWGDSGPRWAIRRAGAQISAESLGSGSKWAATPGTPGIRVSDGERSVHCIPYYQDIPRHNRIRHVEQALCDLGENPARHITA
jgi:hypothetical protein